MSGGSFCYCPACGKISILGATCPCGHRTDMPVKHAALGEQSVKRVRGVWVGTCDHGDEGVWTIHRSTEYAATRSLSAHLRDDHPDYREEWKP